MNEIARRPQAAVSADVSAADVVADLARFQATILDQLAAVGLPTDGVLASIDERDVLLTSLGGALRRLPDEDRVRSLYVSKMIVAAAVGLFVLAPWVAAGRGRPPQAAARRVGLEVCRAGPHSRPIRG